MKEVLAAPKVHGPLTRLQCCPPTSGGAAVVVVSADCARQKGLKAGVKIAGQALTTDRSSSFEGDMRHVIGYDIVVDAAAKAHEKAAIGPEDLDVVELHDCFTTNEFLSYEALGLGSAAVVTIYQSVA